MFESISDLACKLTATGYFIDPVMTQVVFLAAQLQKPLLLEGPAGSGKTQLAVFEAMLLEILSAWQLSIPEFGTVAAKSIPFVVLTSNEERRLGDPIRRRSLYEPITKEAAQSNLLIATRSGQHVTLELVSDGASIANPAEPVDFLIEYRSSRSFLIAGDSGAMAIPTASGKEPDHGVGGGGLTSNSAPLSSLDEEFKQQQRINAPKWTKWQDKQIETSIGDMRQLSNESVISYSILNSSNEPVEIVPPQIQITGRQATKEKKKEGKRIISDQLEIRDYRLSTTRLEPGERADGVVVFDRPNFKESTEKLFLQIAQADQVDRPVLIRLPFTPPISGDAK